MGKLTLLLGAIFLSGVLHAQTRSVSGTILSDQGAPIPFATIQISGTNKSFAADESGNFKIDIGASDKIKVSASGFEAQEFTPDQSFTTCILKSLDGLQEIVITALGIAREKKALGYAVQDISGDKLKDARTSNVASALSGKVAGVKITPQGGAGGGANIQIRGNASVTGNNQPLIVVDGVPIAQDNSNRYGGGISEISPDNIKSISILKGANASALYGSRATNGVILITTKDGKGQKGIGVEINSMTSFERPSVTPKFQNIYGGGSGYSTFFTDGRGGGVTLPDGTFVASSTDGVDESWGSPMDGRLVPQWWSNGERVPLVPHPDNWDVFWQTGNILDNNIALSGANEKGNFRVSFTNMDQKGIAYSSNYKRRNFKFNGGYNFTDKLKVSVSAEYVKAWSDNRRYQGGSEWAWSHRHVDYNQLKDWKNINPSNTIQPAGQYYPYANWQYEYWSNFFYVQDNWPFADNKNRFLGNMALTYQLTDNLSLMVRGGTDTWNQIKMNRTGFSNFDRDGSYSEQAESSQETNMDFLINYTKKAGRFDFIVNAGGNKRINNYKNNLVTLNSLAVDGLWNASNYAAPPVTTSMIKKSEVNSLYASGTVGFDNKVFLDITARNDWSSTLPVGNNSYFYPSASLSAVITDMLPIKSNTLSYAKARVSLAQVGSDTDPYRLAQSFIKQSLWNGTTPQYYENLTISNANLKPEITTGFEAGLELRFFNNRIGLDITRYNQNTRDQIIGVEISKASGYNYRLLNAGKVTNSGWEVTMTGSPITSPTGFNWDITVNWARNRNKVVELAEGLTTYTLATWYLTQEARVGEPYGTFYGTYFQRTPDGQVIFDNGVPILGPGTKALGTFQPDWTGGVLNSFSYKGVTASFLIDVKYGGSIFDLGSGLMRKTGVVEESVIGREEGAIGVGVKNIGTAEHPEYVTNDIISPAQTFYGRYNPRNYHEAGIFDASYVKLREASLGYSFPAGFLKRTKFFQSLRLAVTGRNLLILHKNTPHIDPEVDYYGGNAQGFAQGEIPLSRSVGFAVNLAF